jgi:hypothetical protein
MDTVLVLFAATVLVVGLASRLLKRHALSPVLLTLAVGVLVGPDLLGVLDPAATVGGTRLLEDVARVALALGVADIGSPSPAAGWASRSSSGHCSGGPWPAWPGSPRRTN